MPVFEGVEDMMGWTREEWEERVHYSRKETLVMYMKGVGAGYLQCSLDEKCLRRRQRWEVRGRVVLTLWTS